MTAMHRVIVRITTSELFVSASCIQNSST